MKLSSDSESSSLANICLLTICSELSFLAASVLALSMMSWTNLAAVSTSWGSVSREPALRLALVVVVVVVVGLVVLRLLTPHSDFHRTVQCIRLVVRGRRGWESLYSSLVGDITVITQTDSH